MPKRRRSTWGSVQKVGNGVWRLRYWAETESGGYRRESETVRGTRTDAEDRLAALRAKHGFQRRNARARPGRGPCPTVGSIYETRHLPKCVRKNRERSVANVESAWGRYVGPKWGAMPLDEVRPGDFQDWLLGLPPYAARVALGIMRGVFAEAVLLGHLSHSPLSISFEMPTKPSKAFDKEVIGAPLMDDYWRAAQGADIGAMFILAACAGLRVGESLGVMAGEVEREEVEAGGRPLAIAAVHVVRQVDARGRVVEEGGAEKLKTDWSERWSLVIEPWATRLLSLQDEALARGDVWLVDDGLGNPVGSSRIRSVWYAALEEAGLRRIDLRNLRATFATQMHSEVGMATEDIARLMGHSKPTINFRTYQRPGKDELVKAASKIFS